MVRNYIVDVFRVVCVAAVCASLHAHAQPESTTLQGTLELYDADAADGTSWRFWVLRLADGSRVELRLRTPMPAGIARGLGVAATGRRAADGTFEASDVALLQPAEGEAKMAMSVPLPPANIRVLAVLVKFSDSNPNPLNPFSQSDAVGSLFSDAESVASYFAENAYGAIAITGDVTPWLLASMPTPEKTDSDPCPYSTIASMADTLASAAGYTLSSYQRVAYLFPSVSGCQWAGLAAGTNLWINGSRFGGLISHELGHTFGLAHANLLYCDSGRTAIGGACIEMEQSDFLDTMGIAGLWHHFNAPHKYSLGFLPNGTVATHLTGSAYHTLSPLESPGGATYAIRIPANAKRTYWVEYRQPIGFDSPIQFIENSTQPLDGAVIHISTPNDYNCSDTCLINSALAPKPDVDEVPALSPGQSFVDRASGVRIQVLSQDSSGLTLNVEKVNVPMLGDVDNDGNADLLWSDPLSSTASIWLMKAGAASQAGFFAIPHDWRPAAIGDFDGDGKSDIVWRNTTSGSVAFWFLNGSISQGAMIANTAFFGVGSGWSIAGVGDFDADGRADLLWRHADGRVALWSMNGSTIQAAIVCPSVDGNWSVVGTGDFFGDKKSEVVWRYAPTGDLFLWRNVSSNVELVYLGNAGSAWAVAGIGDFDGDGISDLFWRDQAGENAIWPSGKPAGAKFFSGVGMDWTPIGAREIYGDGVSTLLWRRQDGLVAAWRFDRDLNVTPSFLASAPLNWSFVGP